MTLHLSYIQNVINRMGNNSFLIKGWSMTFVSLLFILGAGKASVIFLTISLIPLIGFWWLDAYYLMQERLYRKLYDEVRCKKMKDSYTMDASCYSKHVPSLFRTIFSPTVSMLYISIILLNIILQLLILQGLIKNG